MVRLFISHSSKDKRFVRKLASDLKALGHDPWLDEWEIDVGDCIVSKLQEGIKQADFVILVLTAKSVASGWVDREWKSAYWSEVEAGNKKLLPVLLHQCEIPEFLRNKQYADFRSRYSDGLAQLTKPLDQGDSNNADIPKRPGNNFGEFRHLKPRQITIRVRFNMTGEEFEVEIPMSLQTSVLKREIQKECQYSDEFLDGRIADTGLYSTARKVSLDDSRTLEENGVQNGEIIELDFFASAG